MPIYTVRVVLELEPAVTRGGDSVEMTHHFWWDDDATAIAELPLLEDRVTNAGISSRWWAVRGSTVHRLILFRRDMADRSSYVRLAEHTFQLTPWPTISDPLWLPLGVSVSFTPTPIFWSRRSAVLVISYGVDPNYRRRTYVGPLSPVPWWVELDTPIPGIGDGFFIYNPVDGDESPGPDDAKDQWRVNVAESARDHVAQFADEAGVTGFSVVPSWTFGDWSTLSEAKCSYVIADLRNRGVRIPLSPGQTP